MSSDIFGLSRRNYFNLNDIMHKGNYSLKDKHICSIYADFKSSYIVVKILTVYSYYAYFKCINKTNVDVDQITKENVDEHLEILGVFHIPKHVDDTCSVLVYDSKFYLSGGIARHTGEISSSIYIIDLTLKQSYGLEIKMPIGMFSHTTVVTHTGDIILIGGNVGTDFFDDYFPNNSIRVFRDGNIKTYKTLLNLSYMMALNGKVDIIPLKNSEYLIVVEDTSKKYTLNIFDQEYNVVQEPLENPSSSTDIFTD